MKRFVFNHFFIGSEAYWSSLANKIILFEIEDGIYYLDEYPIDVLDTTRIALNIFDIFGLVDVVAM